MQEGAIPMDIRDATTEYETWLATRMPLLDADLDEKHKSMAKSAFAFLRATFYRWAELWPEVCATLAAAPEVHAAGDLHVDNFGTWRDAEGRLVWGINDFDEACPMPYTNDLVRLATSALLAIHDHKLDAGRNDACDSILAGYAEGLEMDGLPFILAEDHAWLRVLAQNEARDPAVFWRKLTALPAIRGNVPAEVRRALASGLPRSVTDDHFVHRLAGVGSLGRRRFALLCKQDGSWVAREAKELTTPVWHWRAAGEESGPVGYEAVAASAVRAPDPFVRMSGTWVVHRLSPDCGRIELKDLPGTEHALQLLRAMGTETANVHLGGRGARARVRKDLRRRPRGWLRSAAQAMADATTRDWKAWRRE